MNIQHLALQLGNSPVTEPNCSQEHLRNTVQRTASSSTRLIQFQIEKTGKKCMVSLFIYIWHIRKEVFKQRQPLLGWLTEFWLETALSTARPLQAQLCLWFRASYCSKGWCLSSLSCHSRDPAAQGDGSARPSPTAQGTPLPSPHQAEPNPDFQLTFQESVWKLQSFPMCAPKNAFLSPARGRLVPTPVHPVLTHVPPLLLPFCLALKALQKQENTTLWF